MNNSLLVPVKVQKQPDDLTCGPTSLHAVYHYFGDKISLQRVISEVTYLEEGGTLAVMLGCHALKRGYHAKLYTYNLDIVDPSWFTQPSINISSKLLEQLKYKKAKKLHKVTMAYVEFLHLGGQLLFDNLTPKLLDGYFKQQIPVLAGLSATYLYQSKRELTNKKQSIYDDLRGFPSGHFVVLCGYDEPRTHFVIADPYGGPLKTKDGYSLASIQRLINAIMLGIVTYDSNILIIQPNAR